MAPLHQVHHFIIGPYWRPPFSAAAAGEHPRRPRGPVDTPGFPPTSTATCRRKLSPYVRNLPRAPLPPPSGLRLFPRSVDGCLCCRQRAVCTRLERLRLLRCADHAHLGQLLAPSAAGTAEDLRHGVFCRVFLLPAPRLNLRAERRLPRLLRNLGRHPRLLRPCATLHVFARQQARCLPLASHGARLHGCSSSDRQSTRSYCCLFTSPAYELEPGA